MAVKADAIGNVVGRYEGDRPGLPCLMFGSHLDTIRNAGKYDGMLGVVTAIDCVQALADADALRASIAALSAATEGFAAQRMDNAVRQALAGRRIDDLEH